MDAMILAAGRGERLRPLTDNTPKPLIRVGTHCLIEYHLLALCEAGFRNVVINVAHLGMRIVEALGDGSRFGVRIAYSHEPPDALETGGGIAKALSLLKSDPFLVVNADVWTQFPFDELRGTIGGDAHLVLVPNPSHHPQGDFRLGADDWVHAEHGRSATFAGIGVYRKRLLATPPRQRFALAPLLRRAIERRAVSAQLYTGPWFDVGTTERLAAVRRFVAGNSASG